MHSNLPTTKPAYSPPGSRPSSEPSASAPGSRPSSEPTASPPRNPPSYDELFAVPFEDDPPPPYECVPEYKDGSSHQLSKRESKGNGSETCVWLDMGAPKPRYEPVPWMLPKDLHLQHGLKCAAYIPGREPELEVRCSIDPNEKTHKFNQLKVTAKLSNDFLAGTNADISLGASNTTEDIKLFDDAAAGSEATKDVPLQKFWKTDEVPLSSLTHVAFDVRQTSIASNQFKLHSLYLQLRLADRVLSDMSFEYTEDAALDQWLGSSKWENPISLYSPCTSSWTHFFHCVVMELNRFAASGPQR